MNDIWSIVIFPAISAAVLGIFAFFGKKLEARLERIADDQTKKSVAKTVVLAVEQMYKDLHGNEKKQKAVEEIAKMLDEKGIPVTELEIKMLIEEAVAKLNKVFSKAKTE